MPHMLANYILEFQIYDFRILGKRGPSCVNTSISPEVPLKFEKINGAL